MSELHIECPHCGASFEVQIDGDVSNMMVFPCAKCKTPLMLYHGEISELDREEFAALRNRLSKVLNAVMTNQGNVDDVAHSLKQMVDESNARAAEREKESSAITDETLDKLQKNLSEMNVDEFLDSL